MAAELKIDNLSFAYNKTRVLENISISMSGNQMISLVGPNGSGKTTLLKCINKLLPFFSGKILINKKNISELTENMISKLIAYVPQSESEVFPYTVLETVMMGRRPYINWRVKKRDISIVSKILTRLDLEHLANRHFDELSGGEKQKVSIARALVQEPEILLLDEPTSNLDICRQLEVMELLSKLSKTDNLLIIMAMHDLDLAARYSDKIVIIKSKKIFADGSPEDVINPENILKVFKVRSLVRKSSLGYPVTQHVSPQKKEATR